MTNEKKQKLGFRTPAEELQDGFEEIRNLLAGEKAEWSKLKAMVLNKGSEINAELAKNLQKTNLSELGLLARAIQLTYLGLMNAIADLGLTILETHERLAKVEKSISQLNRRIK